MRLAQPATASLTGLGSSPSQIVSDAQAKGEFRDDIDPSFVAMVFYGAIEQLLTGWIFGSIPGTDDDYERAKWLVVETVCGGLETAPVG